MQKLKTTVVILGAGPAGCSASLYLSKFGIDHIVVDKATFPRDKICGDALSGKVVNQLKRLNPEWIAELKAEAHAFTPSWGVIFSAPNGEEVAIPFKYKPGEAENSPGFIAKRVDFDNFLFEKLPSEYNQIVTGEEVADVTINDNGVLVQGTGCQIEAELLISAEGTKALVSRKYTNYSLEKNHHCAGLRAYYSGVKDLNKEGYIELHFVKGALPGYFWIFPLPNGQANVGIGMLSSYVSKHKVNLKTLMLQVIASEKFKERFADAKLEGKILGWGLPLGSKQRPLSGHRFMLTGDAGSLIDPFTGEGIGNAMFSGKWAAEQAEKALQANNYSADFLKAYDKTVYKKLGNELKVSRLMQNLIRFPWLFNWMLGKIKRNKELQQTITFMFDDVDLRKKFSNPLFYLRVLFNG